MRACVLYGREIHKRGRGKQCRERKGEVVCVGRVGGGARKCSLWNVAVVDAGVAQMCDEERGMGIHRSTRARKEGCVGEQEGRHEACVNEIQGTCERFR